MIRSRALPAAALLSAFALCGLSGLSGCAQGSWPDRDPSLVNNVAVSSIRFWPRGLLYARIGDTLFADVIQLRRGFTCSTLQDVHFTRIDSAGKDFFRLQSSVLFPGVPTCPQDPGLDTTLRIAPPTAAGTKLFLATSNNALTDSVLFVSGQSIVDTLFFGGPDTLATLAGFTLRDSTGGHPSTVISDSLATCEALQTATYARDGSTLTVYVRRLIADPLSPAVFPPCAGPRRDSVTAVVDLHGFPR